MSYDPITSPNYEPGWDNLTPEQKRERESAAVGAWSLPCPKHKRAYCDPCSTPKAKPKHKRKSPQEVRRARMEQYCGTCTSCGRECEVVEMATSDEDQSHAACDECLEHAVRLLGGMVTS